jgi:hypothetical protein
MLSTSKLHYIRILRPNEDLADMNFISQVCKTKVILVYARISHIWSHHEQNLCARAWRQLLVYVIAFPVRGDAGQPALATVYYIETGARSTACKLPCTKAYPHCGALMESHRNGDTAGEVSSSSRMPSPSPYGAFWICSMEL